MNMIMQQLLLYIAVKFALCSRRSAFSLDLCFSILDLQSTHVFPLALCFSEPSFEQNLHKKIIHRSIKSWNYYHICKNYLIDIFLAVSDLIINVFLNFISFFSIYIYKREFQEIPFRSTRRSEQDKRVFNWEWKTKSSGFLIHNQTSTINHNGNEDVNKNIHYYDWLFTVQSQCKRVFFSFFRREKKKAIHNRLIAWSI